jgi:Transcriptional regulator
MSEDERPFVQATYRALCRHGFANVTMQDIADETDRSKASLHYHYEGKEDLFETFLERLYEDYRATTEDPPGETPAERLVGLVRAVLSTSDDSTSFTTAYLEIKAQAPYREGYRTRLERVDRHTRDRVAELVTAGVDAGEFPADTDPQAVASFVTTHLHGTWTRSVVADEVAAMRERLVDYVCERLVADATIDRSVGLTDGRDAGAEGDTDDPGEVAE